MKVTLIQSPYLKAFGSYDKVGPISFPMGIGYIASYLIKHGFSVSIIDPENERLDFAGLRKRIREESPDLLGISCVTPTFSNASKIAKITKEETSALVVLGGVHASSLPEATLENCPEFDLIVIGEGEKTMLELCQNIKANSKEFDTVKGVAFRENGKIIKTSPREWIRDVDSLPFPARHLVNMNGYRIQPHMGIGKKTATMITSRGCPYSCIFCSAHISMGRGYRPHSTKYIISEIGHLQQKYGIQHIYFHDDTFTVQKNRVVEICNLLLEKKMGISWICMARADTISEDLIILMKKAGCYGVGFGVESGDERILKNIKKGTTLKQCREAFKHCKKAGLKTYGTFMFGNPGEDHKSVEKTIQFAIELNPDIAMFYVLTPFPGSEIFNSYEGKLFKASADFDSYNILLSNTPHALCSYQFTSKELKHYISLANRRFYFRFNYLIRQLIRQKSFGELKASMHGLYGLVRQIVQTKLETVAKES